MKKLLELFRKYEEIITYLIFGGLTTLVNYAVYLPCYNWLGISGSVSNIISWVAAVAFAFLTNKPFVFKSHDWSSKVVLPELGKFVGCRIGSGVMETVVIFLTVDLMKLNGNIFKLVTSILVALINYVASKLLVFRKNEKK